MTEFTNDSAYEQYVTHGSQILHNIYFFNALVLLHDHCNIRKYITAENDHPLEHPVYDKTRNFATCASRFAASLTVLAGKEKCSVDVCLK